MRAFLLSLFTISLLGICTEAAASDRLIPTLKLQYSGSLFPAAYAHIGEIGYYHMTDYTFLSYGPSIGVAGRYQKGQLQLGPKIGYEINILIADLKLDLTYFNPDCYLQPSLGVSLLGNVGIMVGYNFCLNQVKQSGMSFGVYANIPLRTRSAKAGDWKSNL